MFGMHTVAIRWREVIFRWSGDFRFPGFTILFRPVSLFYTWYGKTKYTNQVHNSCIEIFFCPLCSNENIPCLANGVSTCLGLVLLFVVEVVEVHHIFGSRKLRHNWAYPQNPHGPSWRGCCGGGESWMEELGKKEGTQAVSGEKQVMALRAQICQQSTT